MSAGPELLTRKEAAQYIGMSERWMVDAPIDAIDMKKPGASKSVWRYRRTDLDAFLSSRTVRPGHQQ